MSELTHDQIKDYTVGYNQGYEFANKLPSVTPKMFSNMPDSVKEKPRMKGILDGISQKHKERFIERQKAKSPQPPSTPSKGKDSPTMDR